MSYNSAHETMKHIAKVNEYILKFINVMLKRGAVHDQSKLEEPEKSTFDKITPLLKDTTYGSDEYKKIMYDNIGAIKHHQFNNSHHPEFHEKGIKGMSLYDVVEMFCDWKAASERADGDMWESIHINKKRFGMSDELFEIFKNTAREFD